MTSKEKAKELIEKFKEKTSYQYQEYAGAHYSTFEQDIDTIKQCALICVDEQYKLIEQFGVEYNLKDDWFDCIYIDKLKFLDDVKKEIEKL